MCDVVWCGVMWWDVVWCGVMWGGAHEGMHFSQSKNARLLNFPDGWLSRQSRELRHTCSGQQLPLQQLVLLSFVFNDSSFFSINPFFLIPFCLRLLSFAFLVMTCSVSQKNSTHLFIQQRQESRLLRVILGAIDNISKTGILDGWLQSIDGQKKLVRTAGSQKNGFDQMSLQASYRFHIPIGRHEQKRFSLNFSFFSHRKI